MSNTTNPTRRRRILAVLAAVAALAIGGVVTYGATSGAWFTDSGQGNVTVSTGSVQVTLGDDHGSSDSFNLNYANLVPGATVTQTFYVRNDGSVPATAKVTGLTSFNTGGLTVADLSKFTVTLNGTPVTNTAVPIVLGALNPGQTGTYTVVIGLDGSAGNNFQDKTLTAAGVQVSLEQNQS